MKNKKYVWPVFFLSIYSVSHAADLKSNKEDHLYFKGLYETKFRSSEEAESALKEKPNDTDTKLNYANFYYISGATMPLKDPEGIKYIKKSFEIYYKLWKEDLSNPKIQISLANAYASQGNDPGIDVQTLLNYVMRARNLYTMVIDQYPINLEALLGRIRINMYLTPATGRPDKILEADIENFLNGFEKLPAIEKNGGYFQKGIMEVRLAKAMMEMEKKKYEKAQNLISQIDTRELHAVALKMYKNIQETITKRK